MKRKQLFILFITISTLCILASICYAQENSIEVASQATKGYKALASGIALGLAAIGGAIGMGIAIAKATEGISRKPEAENKIRNTLMLGLVFIETAIIYALVVSILIIFVL